MANRKGRIPRKDLVIIANELIDQQPRRSKNRPASKVVILKEIMLTDKEVSKKVHEMYRQRQVAAVASRMKEGRLSLKPEPPAYDDGNEGIWIDPFKWVIRYTNPETGAAGKCHICSGHAATWVDGKYLCRLHGPVCPQCPPAELFTAWWRHESNGTFFCRDHKPLPPPDVEVS